MPHLPQLRTSPGRTTGSCDAYATGSANGQPILEQVLAYGLAVNFHCHGDRQEPLGVVQVLGLVGGDNLGPSVLAKSLPLHGPRLTFTSRRCRSRAD